MSISDVGALCFGVVIGWIAYRTLRRADKAAVSDIATVVGAVGGAAVSAHFDDNDLFGYYAIGLAAGYFFYLLVGLTILKDSAWLGGD